MVILLFIIRLILHNKKSKKRRRTVSRSINRYNDQSDIEYAITSNEKRLSEEIKRSKSDIQRAIALANKNISIAWIDSYEKTLRITNNLQKNLEYQQSRYLRKSKFQYYTSLHFRSMLAADMAYKNFKDIDKSFEEINVLILNIKNGVIKVDKDQKDNLYLVKDKIKEARKVLLDRVHDLNNQTRKFKRKIGRECGERGRQWEAERNRHK